MISYCFILLESCNVLMRVTASHTCSYSSYSAKCCYGTVEHLLATHMPDSPCNSAFPCISRIFPEDRIIYCKVKSTHHFYPFPKRFRHKIVQARRPWADLLPKRLVWPSALIEIEMTSLKRCHVKSNIIVWTLFILGKIWFRVKLEWCQLQSPQKISLSRKGSGVHHRNSSHMISIRWFCRVQDSILMWRTEYDLLFLFQVGIGKYIHKHFQDFIHPTCRIFVHQKFVPQAASSTALPLEANGGGSFAGASDCCLGIEKRDGLSSNN